MGQLLRLGCAGRFHDVTFSAVPDRWGYLRELVADGGEELAERDPHPDLRKSTGACADTRKR